MVDLQGQYLKIKDEIDAVVGNVVMSSRFINGPEVSAFQGELANYTKSKHVIPCASGTDALQLSLMALHLQPGDEVITVPFTFVSTVEVIALLGLKPVFVDVCPDTFNMDVDQLEKAITGKTKVILPVHLFGQCANMERIMEFAKKHHLYVVEDACQSLGAEVRFTDGSVQQAGTMGTMGCTSFFPSKNLGCYGDGGAVFTQDDALADQIRMMANHGMQNRYYYDCVGLNSRLDALQAAVLRVKLRHLDEYIAERRKAAALYAKYLMGNGFQLPVTAPYSTHVFHQFTLKVESHRRTLLVEALRKAGVPTAVYYPLPIHLQKAYSWLGYQQGDFPVSEKLSKEVISLPMHTELQEEQIEYIAKIVNQNSFNTFKN